MEMAEIEVLECPNCHNHFSKDHLKEIEDEICPYCNFNYALNEKDDASDRSN